MTATEQHLTTLMRRRMWLDRRVEKARAEGVVLGYDDTERMALDWAINELCRRENIRKDTIIKNAMTRIGKGKE